MTEDQIKSGKKRGLRALLIIGIIMSALMFISMYSMHQKGNIDGAKVYLISWTAIVWFLSYIYILMKSRVDTILSNKELVINNSDEYLKAIKNTGLKLHWHILRITIGAIFIIFVGSWFLI